VSLVGHTCMMAQQTPIGDGRIGIQYLASASSSMPLLDLALTCRFAMWGSLPNVGISDKNARAVHHRAATLAARTRE